jgi:hypothetical protein
MFQNLKHTIAIELARIKSEQVINSFYKSNQLEPSKNIVITGSPRSGTTWLAEILSKKKGSFMLFEPLSLTGVKRVKEIGFDWRQHIPEDAKWTEAEHYFTDLLNGKHLTPWMLSHSDKNKLKDANYFILKFVRANLLLPWFIKNFKPQKLPIYIVRNPLSVVASQMSLDWKNTANHFEVSKSKFSNELYGPYANVLGKINSTEEHLTAKWCIENRYLLAHPNNNKNWISCTYENLLMNPEIELKNIHKRLDMEFTTDVLTNIQSPSKSSYKDANSYETEKIGLDIWKQKLSDEQKNNCLKIISQMGMESICKTNWNI